MTVAAATASPTNPALIKSGIVQIPLHFSQKDYFKSRCVFHQPFCSDAICRGTFWIILMCFAFVCLIKAWAEKFSLKEASRQQGKNCESKFNYGMFYCFFRGTARVLCRFPVFRFKTTRQLEQIFCFPDENFRFTINREIWERALRSVPFRSRQNETYRNLFLFCFVQLSFCLVAYFFNK